MPNGFLLSKLNAWSRLMRLHTPAGYLLCFFPAAYGLLLASDQGIALGYLSLFFIASIITRSGGCIINDLWDRKLDKNVKRTKDRPLATGEVSAFEAYSLLLIMSLISLVILLTLPAMAIYIGLVAAVLIAIYPSMKRITNYPQIFLGLTFNTGCLIGYATIKNTLSLEAFILYVGCGFWVFAYDTIYGFMDMADDKKIGIKSTAIIFEHLPYKAIILGCYGIFFVSFTAIFWNIIHFPGLIIILLTMLWSAYLILTLDIGHSGNCLYRFKANSWIGVILLLAILLEKLI